MKWMLTARSENGPYYSKYLDSGISAGMTKNVLTGMILLVVTPVHTGVSYFRTGIPAFQPE
jgi:hypothetical protein